MKLEMAMLALTVFVIGDMYYDGKFTKKLMTYQKYYKMAGIAILAFGMYMMLKRSPSNTKNMLLYTNNMIKHLPIDKSSLEFISPVFDLTTAHHGFMEEMNAHSAGTTGMSGMSGMQSKPVKRAVSETKKKYVASMQNWKCAECHRQLRHTFEVDHRVRLEQGGTNEVSNLVALCRECHGEKTAMENM